MQPPLHTTIVRQAIAGAPSHVNVRIDTPTWWGERLPHRLAGKTVRLATVFDLAHPVHVSAVMLHMMFAHGHVLRVLVARWLGLPAGAGQHFLLDTGSLNVLDYYRGIPASKTWNAPLVGDVPPNGEGGSEAVTEPLIGMVTTPGHVKRTKQ